MTDISYIEVGNQGLDQIKPLWEKLIEYHKIRSPYFSKLLETRSFEKRIDELLKKSSGGKLHIDLAMDRGQYIGYCISSTNCLAGEIDSIFVEENHRFSGIGSRLMEQSLAWMKDEQAESIKIVIGVGNESVLPFYQRYGFFPKQILLEQRKD